MKSEQMELNEKVAKLHGKWLQKPWAKDERGRPKWFCPSDPFHSKWPADNCPDYCNDLNACHEFEKAMKDGQLYDYIWKLVGKHWFDTWDFGDVLKLVRATAEQRCRAFVATMKRDDVREASAAKGQGTPTPVSKKKSESGSVGDKE